MTADPYELAEARAEDDMRERTAGVPDGMARCDCGHVVRIEEMLPASPSPYAPPICAACVCEVPDDR